MSNGNGGSLEAPPPHAQLVQMAMGHWVSRIVYVAPSWISPAASPRDQRAPTNSPVPPGPTRPRCIASCGRWRRSASSAKATAAVLAHAARRSAQGRCAWRRALVGADHRQRLVDPWIRRADVLAADGQERVREGARRADLRLSGQQPGGCVSLQRDDDRLPRRRAAGGGGCLRFLGRRDARRCGRRVGPPAHHDPARYPKTRGILFDLPHVVRDAPALLGARG